MGKEKCESFLYLFFFVLKAHECYLKCKKKKEELNY